MVYFYYFPQKVLLFLFSSAFRHEKSFAHQPSVNLLTYNKLRRVCVYLVKVFLRTASWFGEVIPEAVSGLGIEWQSRWRRGGCGLQHTDWSIKRLWGNAYCFPPTQLHFKTHYRLTCKTQRQELNAPKHTEVVTAVLFKCLMCNVCL